MNDIKNKINSHIKSIKDGKCQLLIGEIGIFGDVEILATVILEKANVKQTELILTCQDSIKQQFLITISPEHLIGLTKHEKEYMLIYKQKDKTYQLIF